MSELKRFGISIEKDLLEKFDEMIADYCSSRSEAIRDLIRSKIVEEKWKDSSQEVIGSLTLVYNHHQRGLTEKMLAVQHNYHHLFKSNLHLHLDHENCLEVIVVQGRASKIKSVSRKLISLKGVKHGQLSITTGGSSIK